MKTLAKTLFADEIRQRVLKVKQSDQPRWGLMDANQMMCHLRAAYADALSSMPIVTSKLPLPPLLVKTISLTLPLPWPRNLPTLDEYRVGGSEMTVTDFDTDKAGLLKALDAFCVHSDLARAHPFFGEMSRRDWMRWGYLHADHHLRQFGK